MCQILSSREGVIVTDTYRNLYLSTMNGVALLNLAKLSESHGKIPIKINKKQYFLNQLKKVIGERIVEETKKNPLIYFIEISGNEFLCGCSNLIEYEGQQPYECEKPCVSKVFADLLYVEPNYEGFLIDLVEEYEHSDPEPHIRIDWLDAKTGFALTLRQQRDGEILKKVPIDKQAKLIARCIKQLHDVFILGAFAECFKASAKMGKTNKVFLGKRDICEEYYGLDGGQYVPEEIMKGFAQQYSQIDGIAIKLSESGEDLIADWSQALETSND